MATFMAAHHGDFTVLIYKKKKAKNSIDNSSQGLIRHSVLLITFVLAMLLRPADGGPCGRAACGCLLPFWTPHAVCPTLYTPRRTPHDLHRVPHAVRPTPYAPRRTLSKIRRSRVHSIFWQVKARRGEARQGEARRVKRLNG
jgi:hypothetical protein